MPSAAEEMHKCLDKMHNSCQIAHCDIKLENIMVKENREIMLIDFGFSE